MRYGERLSGTNGWLAFLIVSLAVLSPLGALVSAWSDLYRDPATATVLGTRFRLLEAYDWLRAAALVAVCWFLAWRLEKRRAWRTVRIVVAGLWLTALLPGLLDAALLSALLHVPPGRLLAGIAAARARPILYAALWTAYLLRSERVRNTYPVGGDAAELGALFH